ncbi:MAG TPA: hypothetical protein VNR37_03550 [Microbacteriaceae bacterium]|nr:hypothetical protein [Microbacteriaceae bacterium]
MSEIIPSPVKLAAKRAFIRTLAQGYATTLGGTVVSVPIILGLIQGTEAWVPIIVAVAVAVVSPFIGAAAAYFGMLRDGIPDEYKG